ncbi:transmembrane protein, putative [Medicago truncatula]|uniref:Transmembrane protein, putative n=1 Tax=Medicago truncatula TaxID=3880 RepID=G7KDC1_MEDTR|nr:transmembrane protein, putative [Medicago truncatula]
MDTHLFRCATGCGEIETDTHLFLSCSIFGKVWQLVRRWLGVHSADPLTIIDHYIQFGTSSGLAKSVFFYVFHFVRQCLTCFVYVFTSFQMR